MLETARQRRGAGKAVLAKTVVEAESKFSEGLYLVAC